LGSFNQNANSNAYFLLEDFYGYSGIKPRAFQDLMDVVGPVNQTLWRLTNVKYIIMEQQVQFPGLVLVGGAGKEFVYKNENVLPRFFLANKVEQKPALEVLRAMKSDSFDPKEIAFVQDEKVVAERPDSTTSIAVEKYQDENITLKVNASGNNFLVFSSTYMPKGWHAVVDKSETKIYRVDHALMGIIVPKGIHQIEFRYEPKSFVISKYLALSLSSMVVIGLLITIVFEVLKKKKSIS
ncbi:MAG: YfhO family protein, partial [Ignavibacteriaceae bacterium]